MQMHIVVMFCLNRKTYIKNFFDIMSEHSRFILKQRFGDNLFDFTKEDMQVFVFKYTIIDRVKEERLMKEKNLRQENW